MPMDPKQIDDLTARLSELLPADIRVLKEDFEKNVRATLHGAFERLELVSREEFEAQSRLLSRSREKLEALEARLAELEKGR